jgi:hypothetical protein
MWLGLALFCSIREELPFRILRVPKVILVTLAGAAMAEPSPVPPGDGNVDASGKFIPAEVQPAPKAPPTPGAWREQAAGLIEKTGEMTFRIGKVLCDREARTIRFPASVNAREGLIEYALVTTKGKVHESLLATEVSPLHVQMAALLMGLSPKAADDKPVPVLIEVSWATNGPERKLPLEDLVALARESPQGKTGATLGRGPWLYQGSVIEAGGFAAERDGSIISLISDPAALAGNPRPGHEDDSLHVAHTAALPPVSAPVTVTLRPAPSP